MFFATRQKALAARFALLTLLCACLSQIARSEQSAGIIPGDTLDSEMLESAGDLGSPALDFQDTEQPVLVSPDATSYQFYITDLESRYGAYAPGLSEQLLGLGSAYQNQGLHTQAIDIFKRAVHLARINGGLYSGDQIPSLQRLIRSLVAVGDFESADERQFYLYRVQTEVYGRQSEQMSLAMLERAEWEREAYYLSVGESSFLRLLRMWELYSAVLKNVARDEGKFSERLLTPLNGLLQTQYLISTYTPDSPTGIHGGPQVEENFAEEARFSMVRVSNYKQGQAVISAMREVYGYNESDGSPLPADALVKLGDWHLWHQKRESALEIYQQAWDELGMLEGGEELQQKYFGTPTMLPDLPGANKDLTSPDVVNGYANVTFNISASGRVKNLELIGTEAPGAAGEDAEAEGNPVPLLRRIKRLQFRPRMVDREPVPVEDMRERYAF